jgi:uncharacterized membrane protein YhhN
MMELILIIATLVCAVVDWAAVAKGWRKVEIFTKPATMVLLFGYLAYVGGFRLAPLIFFGSGLIFSLVGDIFLLFSDRWFLPGLGAFLLAHVSYILGMNIPFGQSSPLWGTVIGILLAIVAGRLLKRIIASLRSKGLNTLVVPVVVYGLVITLMLLSAILTNYRPDWNITSAVLVSVGAFLFFFSDVILAWNKFVVPIRNGRIINMVTYHVGQIALIAGVLIQFPR